MRRVRESDLLLSVFSVVILLSVNSQAQDQGDTGIGGTWTISFAAGGNPDATQDSRTPVGPPPLKPEYRSAWEEGQRLAREANARGEPLATAATFCLPQGMPAMMGGGGPFPMEILLSPGQVTIIQEAYTQIRRIYLDTPQATLENIEPGFLRSVSRPLGRRHTGRGHDRHQGIGPIPRRSPHARHAHHRADSSSRARYSMGRGDDRRSGNP